MMKEEKIKNQFQIVVNDIKSEIKTTQINTFRVVDSNLIMMYFRVVKILNDNSKYGNSFIKNIAHEIKIEFPSLTGFSERNLRRMKLFYIEYKEDEKWPQLVANLPWGHNILLIEKITDVYLSAIDDLVKDKNDNPTIKLILCKDKDKIAANYSLKDINKPININSFELK